MQMLIVGIFVMLARTFIQKADIYLENLNHRRILAPLNKTKRLLMHPGSAFLRPTKSLYKIHRRRLTLLTFSLLPLHLLSRSKNRAIHFTEDQKRIPTAYRSTNAPSSYACRNR